MCVCVSVCEAVYKGETVASYHVKLELFSLNQLPKCNSLEGPINGGLYFSDAFYFFYYAGL